ncbi:cytokinin riboside 5'-monophosphate phosphoribohydrolase [Novimethylophilus kurashikiensis]|uniref:AMP nucleosidase n=1 Tax=Novimethylophilus kurashikiensis TaxID=1825523 RepID=A0A2R5F925_9PROT|nr:nucleotide 5'-monophosphate nucleosidase PpnN [Novimethylophilus kurashikiensis]GBG14740.1 cytokinin riboside 5'-monophosphate phosphoribohydrolase [Novimethylophilus kurashikiensis]
MEYPVHDTQIAPLGRLEVLSRTEAAKLLDSGHGSLHELYRNCSLAVLNTGNELDDAKELLERYSDFDIRIIQRPRGIKLDISNAPATAFVDGRLIVGIQEHLFSVLRDVIYMHEEIRGNPRFDLDESEGITDAVFHILRNASVLRPRTDPKIVVCWGGHSINRQEYEYTKHVGYQLGLRGLDICTGCGPGAMKGPMKGAAIGHAKQRIGKGRYIGFTEPGIIAGESPNPIVNELVILPDVEKRLEAFIRFGHGFVVFPGGAGTAEEIFYVLGVLLNPKNADLPFPLIFTGPKSAEDYFMQIDQFIGEVLGVEAQRRYKIIIDDPVLVAQEIQAGIKTVRDYRKQNRDAYYFDSQLKIEHEMQRPFHPTHDNMRKLKLHLDQPKHTLIANLRRAFSGIVAGNIKDAGIRAIEKHGKFEIYGDEMVMQKMDALLSAFVEQHRMKLTGRYEPCYRIMVEQDE